MPTSFKSHLVPAGVIKTLDTGRQKPFVSVVTPTWNRGAFLPWLVYMFRYQDYPADRRELVILDDSPQSHLPVIEQLTNGNPGAFNIRYIHYPERLALGKKRNMLNSLATGEYILCMDDDDYYPPDKISYTIAMMQRHRALISGSDQIPVWYSHINRIFKTRSFGAQNILNGTFCYHRNYLKKHRYDDACNLSEEESFTNKFTANPLQLPGERTILCISHSHNTFDKDFVLGASEPLNITLEEAIHDPLLRNRYLSLHNATCYQPIRWQALDRLVIVNLDRRADRLRQIRHELAQLNVPEEKIVRLAACDAEDGQWGRRQSHLQALQMAQQQGWRNYLLLEDDAVILKQEKHINVLNSLLASLASFPWQVLLLGGEICQGTVLKSLNGVIHARDCRKVCAYLVNGPYYSRLAQQMQTHPAATLEAQWQPLLREDKWLACYPSLSYQRPGYSDIEKRETDNIGHYFNKVTTKSAHAETAAEMPASAGDETLCFYMETIENARFYSRIIQALPVSEQKNILVLTPWTHIKNYSEGANPHCRHHLVLDGANIPLINTIKANKSTLFQAIDDGIRHSREFRIQKTAYEKCWSVYLTILGNLTRTGILKNIKKIVMCSGNGLAEKPVSLYCKINQIATDYIELANFPNKVFIDPQGANARSFLAANVGILQMLPTVDEEVHQRWMREYEEARQKPPLQAMHNPCAELIAKASKDRIVTKQTRYLFLPLQVSYDTQLWINADLRNEEAIRIACESARQKNLQLVVKIHPAETQPNEIKKIVQLQQQEAFLISNENTPDLLKGAQEVITINSTVGLEALLYHKPLTILGRCFYKNLSYECLKKYIHHYLFTGIETRATDPLPEEMARQFLNHTARLHDLIQQG